MKRFLPVLIFVCLTATTVNLFSQNYNLVWEDNFNGTTLDSSIWNIEQRIGVWNTGENQELEHYRKENVTVGDDGSGNNCLILTAKKEDFNGYGFTSGRVNTKGKLSFKYGKIEARIKMPDLANGLWPAFWTLGYTDKVWPYCGEIDILEMGHSQGISAGTQNKYIGAACHWETNGQDLPYYTNYTASVNLNEDYHQYTLIWSFAKVEIYLDNASTPYFVMNTGNGTDLEEYRDYPEYLLFNLAVGGSLPGITDTASITAPLPGSMYIDYVKVYQIPDAGEFNDSSNLIFGNFGVYEEAASTDMNSDLGYDASIQTSGLTERAGETPKEGDSVLSYTTTAGNDFSFSYNSDIPKNMTNYAAGSVQFWFKSESTDSISVGISDTAGNTAFITLKDGVKMNPVRDGQWNFAWIPISELGNTVDLSAIKGFIIIKGNFAQDGYFSIDRVIWSVTDYISTDADYYGIFAEHESITVKLNFASGGHIYTWNGFTAGTSTPFYGSDVLSYKPNAGTWNGFGIQSDDPLDLSPYYNGALHFSYKTKSTEDIEIGFKNSTDKGWKKVFTGSSELTRDEKWHEFQISIKDFTFDNGAFTANDLKDIAIPFYLVGTVEIALDEIYLSKNGVPLDYPEIPNSTETIAASDKVYLFPNPVKNQLNITGIDQKTQIIIIDQLGRVVLSQVMTESGSIDVSELNNGFYSVQINNSSSVRLFHIVKN
jgi:beta-glucanase (GH16 family)